MSESSVHQVEPLVGYKQTDLGLLPDCWDSVLIGDLFVFKNGLNKAKRFFGTGTPIVNYMDVFERPGLTTGDLSGRVNLSPEEIKAFEVRLGDVFFTRTSETVEEVGVASVMLDEPCDTVFSGFVLRARPRDGRLNDRFKQYCFATRGIRSQIVSNATYTTRALTNGRSLSAVQIAVPPKPEQRAIAEALSDVDGLLSALDALIDKKRAIKQAVMQQLLTGKTRLPGFEGKWETKRLGEIGDISGAGVDKKFSMNEIPVRLVNYLDVYHKTFLYSEDLVHEVSAKPNHIRRCVVEKGDIFFTPTSEVRNDIGRSAVAMEDIPDGAYSYHVVRLRLKKDWDLHFRAYAFDTKSFLDQANKQCEGSGTRYVITLPKFRSMVVRFPPSVEEQAAIATVLSDMDAEIAALEQRRDKTRAMKQGMMQALLTGRVRLVEPGMVEA